MAVYTDISDDELDTLLETYSIGEALSCKGIAEGVENRKQGRSKYGSKKPKGD